MTSMSPIAVTMTIFNSGEWMGEFDKRMKEYWETYTTCGTGQISEETLLLI